MTLIYWLAETTVVAAVLAMIVALVCRFWGDKLGPGARHALWLVVLLKLMTPPLFHWPRPPMVANGLGRIASPSPPVARVDRPINSLVEDDFDSIWNGPMYPAGSSLVVQAVSVVPDESVATTRNHTPISAGPLPNVSRDPSRIESWSRIVWPTLIPWVIAAWVLGGVTEILRQARRVLVFRHRIAKAIPAPESVIAEVRATAALMHIDPPRVLQMDGLGGPMLWCLGNPVLLLPAELVGAFKDGKWAGVLIHELAHLRRGDHWVARLDLIAGAIWWFSPVYRLTRSRIRSESELACDAWVVDLAPESKARRAYAEALLTVCERISMNSGKVALGFGAADGLKALEDRLNMILRDGQPRPRPGKWWLAAAILALVTLPGFSQAPRENKGPYPIDRPKSTNESPPNSRVETKQGSTAADSPAALIPAPVNSTDPIASMREWNRVVPSDLSARVTIHREVRSRSSGPGANAYQRRTVVTTVSDTTVSGMSKLAVDEFVSFPTNNTAAKAAAPSGLNSSDLTRTLLYRVDGDVAFLRGRNDEFVWSREPQPFYEPWNPSSMPWSIDARSVLRELLSPAAVFSQGPPTVRLETFRSASGAPMSRLILRQERQEQRLEVDWVRSDPIGKEPTRLDITLRFSAARGPQLQTQTIRARLGEYRQIGPNLLPTKMEIVQDLFAADKVLTARERARVDIEYLEAPDQLPDSRFRFSSLRDPNRVDDEGDGPANRLPAPNNHLDPKDLPKAAPALIAAVNAANARNPFGPSGSFDLVEPTRPDLPSLPRYQSLPVTTMPGGFTPRLMLPAGLEVNENRPLDSRATSPTIATTSQVANLRPTLASPVTAPPTATVPLPSDSRGLAASAPSNSAAPRAAIASSGGPTPATSSPAIVQGSGVSSGSPPSVSSPLRTPSPASPVPTNRPRSTLPSTSEPATATVEGDGEVPPPRNSLGRPAKDLDSSRGPMTIEDIIDQLELQELRRKQGLRASELLKGRTALARSRVGELTRLHAAGQISFSEVTAVREEAARVEVEAERSDFEVAEADLLLTQLRRRLDRERKRTEDQIASTREELDRMNNLLNKGLVEHARVRELSLGLDELIRRRDAAVEYQGSKTTPAPASRP